MQMNVDPEWLKKMAALEEEHGPRHGLFACSPEFAAMMEQPPPHLKQRACFHVDNGLYFVALSDDTVYVWLTDGPAPHEGGKTVFRQAIPESVWAEKEAAGHVEFLHGQPKDFALYFLRAEREDTLHRAIRAMKAPGGQEELNRLLIRDAGLRRAEEIVGEWPDA